jgi:hypothetical protein
VRRSMLTRIRAVAKRLALTGCRSRTTTVGDLSAAERS